MYRVSDTVRSTHNRDGAIVLDVRQGQIIQEMKQEIARLTQVLRLLEGSD